MTFLIDDLGIGISLAATGVVVCAEVRHHMARFPAAILVTLWAVVGLGLLMRWAQ